MDKDIERLGKERLKRQKKRKRWMTSLVALMFLVLGITGYQLIQPASASDKDKAEFTVEDSKDTYTNLAKLSNTPEVSLDASSDNSWDGEHFSITVDLDFCITKAEAASAGTNYYYVFSDSVYISDKLCSKWYDHQDKNGDDAFSYHFLKTDEGNYAVVVKFVDGYITDDISAGIKFNCSADGTVEDDGDVKVDIGGEVYITVDSTEITWDKSVSVNYDIAVEKTCENNGTVVTDDSGNKYVDYTLKISTTKGTPDCIIVSDILSGNGIKVDTSNPSIVVKKNGSSKLSSSKYTATVTQDSSDSSKFVLDASLPKLSAGEYYTVTYRYYVDVTDCNDNNVTYADNKVNVTSTDTKTNEKVIDYSSANVCYKKSTIKKDGSYTDGVINWTITVNESKENIAGYVLTDSMMGSVYSVTITSDTDTKGAGYKISKNSDGTIKKITFKATSNSVNNNSYVIKYTTTASPSFSAYNVTNEASLKINGTGTTVDKTVEVPANGNITKELVSATDYSAACQYILEWKSVIEVPSSGIPSGTVVKDTLSTASNSTEHYMTYKQVADIFNYVSNTYGSKVGNFKVKATDYNTYDWSAVSSNSFTGYTEFTFEFLSDLSYWECQSITLTYKSTADYSSGSITSYKNTIYAGTVMAEASYSKTTKVKKTDGNGNTGTQRITGNSDGTVTWKVQVTMDADSDTYTIKDTMPSGVTVNNVYVELKYDTNSRYNIPTDGSTYTISDYGNYYFTAGIKASASIDSSSGSDVVKTVISKNSTCNGWSENSIIYITYKCSIDDYASAAALTEFNLKNYVKVSTNKVDNYGESNMTQIVTKPNQSSSSDEEDDSGETVLDKEYSWNNSEHILNYTVTINPDSKDLVENCDTLSLKDVVTYSRYTWTGGKETWEVHIIPTTVALYYAKTSDDGSLKTNGKVDSSLWNWTYEESKEQWQEVYYDTITASVPDGCAMILKYSYAVTLVNVESSWGTSKISIDNTATLQGVSNGSSTSHSGDEFTDEGTSAYIYKNNEYVIYKVEEGNYGNVLPGAEFTVYKYDPTSTSSSKTSDGYVPCKTYTTGDDGSFAIEFELKYYTYNQQYYVVETKAPSGYLLPDDPEKYYFYFAADDTTKYSLVAESSGLQGCDLSEGFQMAFVEDEKMPTTSLAIYKNWIDSDGNKIEKTDGSIFLQLYQIDSDGTSKAYGNLIEVTPDEDGDWYYAVTDLPANAVDDDGNLLSYKYKYYVEEVGIDEKYTVSGFSVSYVYTGSDGTGFAVMDGKDTIDGIESGTIEITNKEISYELPATGGSGNRWLYMLSGGLLALLAVLSLIYKCFKLKFKY